MKYVYTEALTPHREPWGIYGVFPKDVVDAAPRSETDEQRRPIIDEKHLIVGRGPGWDNDLVEDEDWLKRAVAAMNALAGDPPDTPACPGCNCECTDCGTPQVAIRREMLDYINGE